MDTKEITVKMVSSKHMGVNDGERWWNFAGAESDRDEAFNKLSKLGKGSKIKMNLLDDGFSSFTVLQEGQATSKGAGSGKVINIKGKDFVTYKGLLDLAHKDGLTSIEIKDSWVNEDMSKAWCIVRAIFVKDKNELFFDGFGSSTPDNTGAMTESHPVEMSHTRAKARALRDALNISETAIEELKQGKN